MDLPLLYNFSDEGGCLRRHWIGLPGDVCTLVPGAEDQGGVVQDVLVQEGGRDCT